MTERRKIIEACERKVENTLNRQLKDIQIEIANLSRVGSMDEITELLTEANSIISFICGDDNELYEIYHYRLFKTEEGKLIVIQAEELNVEDYPYERFKDED